MTQHHSLCPGVPREADTVELRAALVAGFGADPLPRDACWCEAVGMAETAIAGCEQAITGLYAEVRLYGREA